MAMRIRFVALLWLMPVLGMTGLANAAAPLSTADAFFESNVRPLLAARCFKCHGRGDKLKGGLNLTSRAAVLAGGERGPAAVPGKPAASRLIQAVRHDGDLSMPPGKKLTDNEIDILVRWVRMALPWPESDTGAGNDTVGTGLWSLQPLKSVELPTPKSAPEAVNPVDRFVITALEGKGLTHSAPADKPTLIRRVTFDLVGLPPTLEEVDAFLADDSPGAFDRVVDRLLASPHYGERWARHWLDLARYAESEGFKADETRPNVWQYRDYVIKAFNEDKPYNRFVREQIAGDELWPNDPDARVATAFNRHYPDESNARNLVQRRQEILNDITDTVGSVFLGLTVACARCHDHKYDPITQKDYYELQAFFANVRADDYVPLVSTQVEQRHREQKRIWEAKTATLRKEMSELEAKARESLIKPNIDKYPVLVKAGIRKPASERTAMDWWFFHKVRHYLNPDRKAIIKKLKGKAKERWLELEEELDQFAHLDPEPLPLGAAVIDVGREPLPTHVLSVGVYDKPKERVEPAFLSAIDPQPPTIEPPEGLDSTGRRSVLANWLADSTNPLPARVIVNRIWHYHFGRGLVGTPSDFGVMGDTPTHPELLDWLAVNFIQNGWRIKDLHRLMLASRTYQQASDYRADAVEIDPENRMLWRFSRQRLEGELIRDAALAVAGRLNLKMGGPSMFPELPPGMKVGYNGWHVTKDRAEHFRRSIYVFVRRNTRYPLFEAFDMPDTHESCPVRSVTTNAPQALMMLNSKLALGWARSFAGRVLQRAGSDLDAQVTQAYRLAYARRPDARERETARQFFARHRELLAARADTDEKLALPPSVPDDVDTLHAAVLVDFCHMLMNSSEFVYRS